MRVVIIEDEPTVAGRIRRLTEKLLANELTSLTHFDELDDALDHLSSHPIDLLLLDLNLHGRDGFEILANTVSGSYHTIIISAYAEKALRAFEFGVLDFIAKPFSTARLRKAFKRFHDQIAGTQGQTRHLAVKRAGQLEMIDINSVIYIRGADNYSELVLENGETRLHDKNLTNLLMVLPERFLRIHKSYIVDLDRACKFLSQAGSKYELVIHSGEKLPVGRTRVGELRERLI